MESQYPKILGYQDAFSGSTSAIKRALSLAENDNSKITVMDVVPPLNALWDRFESEHWEMQQDARQRKLDELVKSFHKMEFFETTKVLSGRPTTQIIREVVTRNFDLVIKEAHSKKTDFLFGSLDQRLIRQCPVPVLLTSVEPHFGSRRILVAVDPADQESETKLNSTLIHHASSIAKILNMRLYVVGAWQYPYLAGYNEEISLKRFEKHERRIKQEANTILRELAAQSLKPLRKPEDIILRNGAPDDVILTTIDNLEPELLVIGSIAQSGLSGFLLGSTAERVLQQIKCSILVVKPEGFDSPIASRFKN